MATKIKTTVRAPIKLTDNFAETVTDFADAPAIAPGTLTIRARKGSEIVEHVVEFEEAPTKPGLYPDKVVAGLFLYVGPRKTVWRFRQRRTTRNKSGKRPTIAQTLGTYPETTATDARKAALKLASDQANDNAPPSKREAVTFEKAWEPYLDKLLRNAREKGKPPRHHANAKKLGDNLILPQWGKWSLRDLAQAPEEVETWHSKVTRVHGPVSANRACELVRACYNHRAARDVTLSLDRIPTSSVQWNKEEPAQDALAPKEFKKWRTAWDDIESDIHKGYYLFNLLAGTRPGEAARIRRQDIDRKARTFTIPNAKAGKDIVLPMTREIEFAIDLALNATPTSPTIKMKGLRGMKRGEVRVVPRKRPHHEIVDPDFVFPGCKQVPSRSGLPAAGNALRHTFKTMHVELGISEMLSSFLLGHALDGVNQKYTAELIIIQGPALRKAQEKVSRRVFELLGLTILT